MFFEYVSSLVTTEYVTHVSIYLVCIAVDKNPFGVFPYLVFSYCAFRILVYKTPSSAYFFNSSKLYGDYHTVSFQLIYTIINFFL